jgi:hypothetical protein
MKTFNAALAAGFVLLISATIVLSLVPPVGRDDLIHHLAVPKLYLGHGGIYEIPSLEFSYYPMNLELLYLIPLYFGNDIAPKFIHFGFALLTAWLIFRYLRRRINLTYALIGVILFLSVPIIIKLSISAYVDLGLVFFSTAALLLIPEWIDSGFRLKYLILSAIFCGLALGTKYNALIIFFLLTLFVMFLCSGYIKDNLSDMIHSVKYGIIYAVIALLIFSPWMIRNWQWTENPIYPLYRSLFNPDISSETTGAPKKSYGLFTFRGVLYDESAWEMALVPLRIFFQGEDGNPKYFDGKLSPFLLLLPIAAFYRPKEELSVRNEKKILLSFSILFFTFTFFTTVLRVRYLVPMIPPLVILSVFGLKNIAQANKWLMYFALSVFLMLNGHYIVTQFDYVKPIEYLSGKISRDDYILRYRPEHAAMQYINRNLSKDALLLFMFTGNRGYYCDRKYLLDSPTNTTSMLTAIINRTDSPESLMSELRRRGITHFLIGADLFASWINEQPSQKQQLIIREFLEKYVSKLFFEKGYAVLKVEYPDV